MNKILSNIYESGENAENAINSYIGTRGAPKSLSEKFINKIFEDSKRSNNEVKNILFIGTYNGINDFIPFINQIELNVDKGVQYRIVVIDSSIEIENLKESYSEKNNVKIEFIQDSIERIEVQTYLLENYKFDIIILFSVISHLINWHKAINFFYKILDDGGSFYINEFKDVLIESIENNLKDSHKKNKLIEFHENRLKKFDTFYSNTILGTSTSKLKYYALRLFKYEISSTQKYPESDTSIEINASRVRSKETKHTPFFVGSLTNINLKNNNEDLHEDYDDFIKKHFEEASYNIKIKKDSCQATLLKFTKKHKIDISKPNSFSFNLEASQKRISKFLNKNYDDRKPDMDRIALQILYANQAFTYNTNLATSIYWPFKIQNSEIGIDTTDGEENLTTLISSYRFTENLDYYSWHLSTYRNFFLSDTKIEKMSLAGLISKYTKIGFNWVFIREEGIKTLDFEVIDNSKMSFIIIKLPKIEFKSLLNKSSKDKIQAIALNGFRLVKAKELTYKVCEPSQELIISNEVKENIINSKIIRKGVTNEEFFTELSKRISYMSRICDIGVNIYITNRIYTGDEGINTGGIFINEKVANKQFYNEILDYQSYRSERYKYIEDFVSFYSLKVIVPKFHKTLKDLNNLITKHAIKSAIAAIMSRNGSHNIGSHVLSAVSYNINHPADMQVFTEYLQQRMDFIAQITTTFPTWSESMSFISQLMRNFYFQRMMLKYIGESEGIDAYEPIYHNNTKNKLRLTIEDKDGNPIINYNNIEEQTFKDIDVAIKGGVTGTHAFYTILENVIRNAAKHSFVKDTNECGLQVKLRIEEVEGKDYICVTIYDNVTKNNDEDHGNGEKFLVNNLNHKLSKPIISSAGELIYKNWGIAEIKIGAVFLNGIPFEELGKEEGSVKIKEVVKAVTIPNNQNKNKEAYVGYEVKIPKPKSLLIIDNSLKSTNKYQNGIKTVRTLKGTNGDLDYDFVYFSNFDKETINEALIEQLPIRTFFKVSPQISDATTKQKLMLFENSKNVNGEKLLKELYKVWLNKLLELSNQKDNKIKLSVDTKDKTSNKNSASLGLDKYKKYVLEQRINNKECSNYSLKDILNSEANTDLNKNMPLEEDEMFKRIANIKDIYIKDLDQTETLPPELDFDNKTSESKETKLKCKYPNEYQDTEHLSIQYNRHNSQGYYYSESLSGSQSNFYNLKEKVSKNGDDTLFHYQLFENGLLTITLLDERVYKYVKEANNKEHFKNLNITFGDINESEQKIKFLHSTKKKESSLDDLDQTHILIVHQSILDKLKIREENKHVWNKLKNKYFRVYVTSGRGKPEPDKFPSWVKYIPFSNIRASMMRSYPEKLLLTKNLLKIQNYADSSID